MFIDFEVDILEKVGLLQRRRYEILNSELYLFHLPEDDIPFPLNALLIEA